MKLKTQNSKLKSITSAFAEAMADKQNLNLIIDPRKASEEIVDFIKNTVKNTGFESVVVGLSGGIDSAVSCSLAARALGAENVIVLMMPYGEGQIETAADARKLVGFLDIPQTNTHEVNIEPLCRPLLTAMGKADKLRRGNAMVRMRMVLLFDKAKEKKALVLGTENKSEYLLGYFTRFGDEASDIEPIRRYYKTEVRQLAEHLGIPGTIVEKEPTAGLWPGQTDEEEFGFTYKEADQILYLYHDKKQTTEEIVKKGLKKETVEKVIGRMKVNDFKHRLPFIFY